MRNIIFATTNLNKIARLKNFLGQSSFKILSLSDLGYNIDEPEEVGVTTVEIAINKATFYWNKLKVGYPVVSQDDTIEFLDIPELNKTRLSIKQPVVEEYGEFNDQLALKYYTNLARQNGGRIHMRFNYGFGLCNGMKTIGKDAKLDFILVDEISNKLDPGYFLTSIMKVNVDDQEIFYSELTKNQQAKADSDLAKAVKYLLSFLI